MKNAPIIQYAEDERHRWHAVDHQRKPTEEQADWVVHRLAEHIQIGPLLRAHGWHVVRQPHDPQPHGGCEKVSVERRGKRETSGGQQQPLRVGDRRADEPGRHRPVALFRVEPVLRAIEQFVQHIVAGGDEARRGDRDQQRGHTRPRKQVRLVEHRQQDAEQHERVLEPVVRAGYLHVGPDARPLGRPRFNDCRGGHGTASPVMDTRRTRPWARTRARDQ